MENRLTEFTERVKQAGGANVSAVVLYGSAVTQDFLAKHSDLNILCILGQADARELQQLHPVADWWVRQGNSVPVFFTMDELRQAADVFAIEMLDMKHRHRMLHGADFLQDFQVSTELHRLQVERELRTNWMRLRQAVLMAPAKPKARAGVMLASVSTFCALFRHALIALGHPMPATKREAVNAIASVTFANPGAFISVLDLREEKLKQKDLAADSTLEMYLEFVEVVTKQVCAKIT